MFNARLSPNSYLRTICANVEQKVKLTIRYRLLLTTTPRTVLSVYFFLIFFHFFAYDPDPKNSDIALTSVITCHHLSEKARPVTTPSRWMIRPTCLFLFLFLSLSSSLLFFLLLLFPFLGVIENAVLFQFPFPGVIENAVFFQFPFPGVIENAVFFHFPFPGVIENAVFFQFPFPGAIENAVFFQFPFPGVIENVVFFQFLFFNEVLCFSSSLSLSQFPSSSLPSSLRGFPMFFQGKCVADFFLLKKTTFLFFIKKSLQRTFLGKT